MNQSIGRHTQNFYFQIILNKLIPSSRMKSNKQFKFSINRGKQIFDQTKNISYQIIDNGINLNRIRLNFIIIAYDAYKSHQFSLKLYEIMGEDEKCIGQFVLDSNSYVDAFLSGNKAAFKEQVHFKNNAQVEMELYIQRNRYSLQKLIREINKNIQQGTVPIFHTLKQNKSRSKDPSVSPRKERDNLFKKNSPKKERIQFTHEPLATLNGHEVKKEQVSKEEAKVQAVEEEISPNKEKQEDHQIQPQPTEPIIQTETHQRNQPTQQTIKQIEIEPIQPIAQQSPLQEIKPQQIQPQQTKKQPQVFLQQTKTPYEEPVHVQITLPMTQTHGNQISQTKKDPIPDQPKQQQVKQQVKELIEERNPQQLKPIELAQDQNVKEFSFQKEGSGSQLRETPFEVQKLADAPLDDFVKKQFSMQFKIGFIIFLLIFLFASVFVQQEDYSHVSHPIPQKSKPQNPNPKASTPKPKKGLKKSVQPTPSKTKKAK